MRGAAAAKRRKRAAAEHVLPQRLARHVRERVRVQQYKVAPGQPPYDHLFPTDEPAPQQGVRGIPSFFLVVLDVIHKRRQQQADVELPQRRRIVGVRVERVELLHGLHHEARLDALARLHPQQRRERGRALERRHGRRIECSILYDRRANLQIPAGQGREEVRPLEQRAIITGRGLPASPA